MTGQLNIVLVPHTHWDREWYQTFQQFRIRLVHTVDKLLDIMDRDPDFSHFMLDGQTIVIDDYLEARPEEEERLRKYTRSGRITVGPWYVQPDEFLVSGESLIRNFQFGLKRAAEFAEPMRVGYVPDCFGHIAQLPQILQGVGIDNAVFWRGIGSEARQSELYWAAPDGTKALLLLLSGGMGYSNARDMPLKTDEFVTHVELLIPPLLDKATTSTLLFMNGSDHLEPQDGLPATLKTAQEQLARITLAHGQHVSGAEENGSYHGVQVSIGTLPQYVAAVKEYLARSGSDSLETLSGEMRSGELSHLLPGVLSTRMWIKQQNAATEHLLERWMEPMTAWASTLGARYPGGLSKLAWKLLLQNQPHDSICGCGIDQVHRENSARFAQSQQIGEQLTLEALQYLAIATDTRAPSFGMAQDERTPREAVPIVVFNPAPGPRTDAVRADAPIAHMDRDAVIVDERGQQVPYQIIKRWHKEIGSAPVAREMVASMVTMLGKQEPGDFIAMAESFLANYLEQIGAGNAYEIAGIKIEEGVKPGVASIEVLIAAAGQSRALKTRLHTAERQLLDLLEREDIHTLEFTAIDRARETIEFVGADLPAYGLKTFWVLPEPTASMSAPASTLAVSANGIENEFYRVEASRQDGTLTVTDKQTGVVLSGLNHFVDGGDVGDLYNYSPPAQDLLVTDPTHPPTIEVTHSPTRVTLRISAQWSLPGAATANRDARSSKRVSCPITSEISLSPGARRIDIHTTLENLAKDHRIRVTFPVLYTVESAAAEGTFEVRTRPVEAPRPANVSEWSEEPVNSFPQKRFVDIGDGKTGLAVLNRGLPEYEVIQDNEGRQAIAVTLLRCVGWLSRGDLATRRGHAGPMLETPEGQCLRHSEFDYALVMHSGDWEAEDALVLREAQAFNTPIRAIATSQHTGSLPSITSMIEAEARGVVVSAIKRSGEGVIVRIYNPLPHAVEASLRPGFPCEKAFAANLLEEPQKQLFWDGVEALHIGLRSGEIATVLFT